MVPVRVGPMTRAAMTRTRPNPFLRLHYPRNNPRPGRVPPLPPLSRNKQEDQCRMEEGVEGAHHNVRRVTRRPHRHRDQRRPSTLKWKWIKKMVIVPNPHHRHLLKIQTASRVIETPPRAK
uniref:Uncharacterized protein n=1 Tax=Cacopsylla melanoneura TaxID=428564 RepID=A0A8D8UK75_9HEMI